MTVPRMAPAWPNQTRGENAKWLRTRLHANVSSRLLNQEDIKVEAPTLLTRLRRAGAYLKDMGGELWKSKLASCGAFIVLVMVLVAIFADVLDRRDPFDMGGAALAPVSWEHWFGTDPYGRDIWSRVVHGARRAMVISASAVALGILLGVPLGAVSGYYGTTTVRVAGRPVRVPLDNILMRLVDAWLAIPGILFFLAGRSHLRRQRPGAHHGAGGRPGAAAGATGARQRTGRERPRNTSRRRTSSAIPTSTSPSGRFSPTACRPSSCRPACPLAS